MKPLNEITYKDMRNFLHNWEGSMNPWYTKSIWGDLALHFFGKNERWMRDFLNEIHSFFQNYKEEKYALVSIKQISETAGISGLSLPSSTHAYFRTSAWGQLSTSIFNSNNKTDRLFLSAYWNFFMNSNANSEITPFTADKHLPEQSKKDGKAAQRRQRRRERTQRNGTTGSVSLSDIILSGLSMLNIIPSSNETQNHSDTTLVSLIAEFNKDVSQFLTLACAICDKLIYPSLAVNTTLGPNVSNLLNGGGGDFVPGNKIKTCSRCHNTLVKGKMPSQSLYNKMRLLPVPPCILNLNDFELSLIKQVKCFLRIILLNKGQGQKAFKGMAAHFPQDVEDVVEQLPLASVQSDILYVTEEHELTEFCRHFEIRPLLLLNALLFLKANNPLYANIHIVERSEADYVPSILHASQRVIHRSHLNADVELLGVGYSIISEFASILRGSTHQGNPAFGEYAGNQCTANCVAFLALANTESPLTWTGVSVDLILTKGLEYYTLKRPTARANFLNLDEVAGTFQLYENRQYNVTPSVDLQVLKEGFLNKYRGHNLPRLQDCLLEFFNTENKCAILICQEYSMALFVEEQHVYWFDAHSRGQKGCVCVNNGRACVIKYNAYAAAANAISFIVHKNVQPKQPTTSANSYRFTITPIHVYQVTPNEEIAAQLEVDTDDEEGEHNISPTVSPAKKKSKCTTGPDINEDEPISDEEEEEGNGNADPIVREFGRIIESDCLITEEDFCEPDVAEYNPNHATLRRRQRVPLNDAVEKNLELLGFPQLFPFGNDGQNETRLVPITVLDYYQQRIMSSDRRFVGNTEYLFYALDTCDRVRAFQMIGVCENMRKEVGEPMDDDLRLNQNLFMRAVRGTPSYWKQYLGDLVAMIKTLGTPTFFLTFSFDDLNSKDCVAALYKAEHGPTSEPPEGLPYQTRKELLNKYPVIAARHFSMRLTKFLAFIKRHAITIFSRPLQDYSLRVEFQARGSPHVHMVMWLENAPDWNTEEGIAFLDRNVSCSITCAFADLVQKYQKHRHTHTCFRKSRCRFHFPQSPSEETKILGDEEIHRNGGRFAKLKRTPEETMINNYHPVLLPVLKANMDIQPVTGAAAIAYYIAKYISKAEPKEIQDKIQDALNKIKEAGHLSAREKACKIAITLLKQREVSAQEAAFRICHLYLRKSSRSTVFVPSFKKENRVRMICKESLGEVEHRYCLNVIDRYMARPTAFEQICLFEFASHFQPLKKPTDAISNAHNDEDLDEFAEEDNPEMSRREYSLLRGLGKIVRRTRPCMVKMPNFNPVSDRENYYHALLLMYLPFREETFLDGHETAEAAFREHCPRFRKHTDDPCINPTLSLEIDQALLRATELSLDEMERVNLDSQFEYEYVEHEDENPLNEGEVFHEAPQNVLEEIQSLQARLNNDQARAFGKFYNTLQDVMHGRTSNVLRLTVNGEGGSGKTFLIKLITKCIKNYLSKDALIVAAPTGKVAFAIEGLTLHRAFSLPVEINGIGKLLKLGGRKLQEFRNLYKNVKFVIIDEMSLINYETLRMVHLRMTEMFQSDDPFAGKHVLLLGDILQMKCPRGSYIFQQHRNFRAEVDLWRLFEFIELCINERQTGGDPLLGICRRLRVGALTMEDIAVLQSRLLIQSNPNYAVMHEEFNDCLWAFPTKTLAKEHNIKKSNELKIRLLMKGKRIYVINSVDTHAEGSKHGQPVDKKLIHKDENLTAGVPASLQLGEGSRIMLRRNKDVASGRVNGAMATVVDFEWNYGREQANAGQLPRRIKVQYDHLGQPEWIEPDNAEFFGKKNSKISRRMYAWILCFGLHMHLLQGITANQIVVNLGKLLFGKGMAYVALSRATTLDGLAISDLDISKLLSSANYKPYDEIALAELQRLRAEYSQ